MPSRWVFYAIYAASGAAGLVYEVAWMRLLGLYLGHTTAAVSTVLASYMGGMAIGSMAGGRHATGLSRDTALRVYAALEGGIGVYAVLLPWLLVAVEPALRLAYADGGGGAGFALGRLLIGLLIVAVPAVAMGATFPVATRWIISDARHAGAEAGGLYASNTVGAAVGALLAGFLLLPLLGLRLTTLGAVGLSVAAAAGALWLARRSQAAGVSSSGSAPPGRAAPSLRRGSEPPAPRAATARGVPPRPHQPVPAGGKRLWLAAAALCVSGFVALVYEVAWTRILAMVIGPTSYAFSAMLAVFIGGLALGSTLGTRIAGRSRQPIGWLAVSLALTAAGAAAVAPVVNRMPVAVAEAVAAPGAAFSSVVLWECSLVALLLLPLTVALGAAVPLAIAGAVRTVEAGPRDVGIVYAMNTAGAIAGALLAGFVFIPHIGLRGTVVAAGAIALTGSLIVAQVGLTALAPRIAAGVIAVLALAGVVFGPGWDRELLAAGAYKNAPYVAHLDFESSLKAGDLLFYADGAGGTVTVRRVAGTTSLAIDGKVDASNGGDMLTQRLLGHMPLLLHGSARRVAVIGLGSGVTAGATLRHRVEEVHILEISREVVRASAFFKTENGQALDDPRARLMVGDGRTHLALSRIPYDVIISEPSNPWMAGMAALFTREFFTAARRRLAPGGLFCQWAHTYDISDADLRSIIGTFLDVFPAASLWLVGEGDILLIGSTAPVDPWLERLPGNFAQDAVRADLAGVGVHDTFSLLSLYVASGRSLVDYAAGAPRQTDDALALEYSAPRAIYGGSTNENVTNVRALADPRRMPPVVQSALAGATAQSWQNRGWMLLKAAANGLAYESFGEAVSRDPQLSSALNGLERAAAATNQLEHAAGLLRQIAAKNPSNVPVRLTLSRLLAAQGAVEEALAVGRQARVLAPGAPEPLEQVASLYADAGDAAGLEALVAEMQIRAPDRAETKYYAATAWFLRGDFAEAARLAEAAATAGPPHARAWSVAGAAFASLRQMDAARRAFGNSLSIDPRNASTLVNLASVEMAVGDLERATRLFCEALSVDQESEVALARLADVLEMQGHTRRAAKLRGRGSPQAGQHRWP